MITQIDSNLLAENVKTKKNGSIRIHSGFFCCACYNLLLPLKTVRTYTKRIKKNKYTKNNTQQVTCFRNKCSSIFFFLWRIGVFPSLTFSMLAPQSLCVHVHFPSFLWKKIRACSRLYHQKYTRILLYYRECTRWRCVSCTQPATAITYFKIWIFLLHLFELRTESRYIK